MPILLDGDRFHTLLLLCLLPLQLILLNYFQSPSSKQQQYGSWTYGVGLLSIVRWPFNYLSDLWREISSDMMERLIDNVPPDFRSDNGKFGSSLEPHTDRPIHLKYYVGQVVIHRKHRFRAVIIGWDAIPKASQAWFIMHYPNREMYQRRIREPHYRLLVDWRDKQISKALYMPQSELIAALEMPHRKADLREANDDDEEEDEETAEAATPEEVDQSKPNLHSVLNKELKIRHSHISHYFSGFDGTLYLPRHWLREIYPLG